MFIERLTSMLKFICLPQPCQQVFLGGAVLALSLMCSPLSGAQNKSDQVKNDDKPHAHHQDRQPTDKPMPGMKMPGVRGQTESAWWYDNYVRSQKQQSQVKGMAADGDMAGMPGMKTDKNGAESTTGDHGSPDVGTMDDVDLMGMMNTDLNLMGTLLPAHKGSNRRTDLGELKTSSSLPGTPGVSHIYHIGATGFFLNHSEQIALSIKQRAALNVVQRKALLNKFTARRKIEEAEQQLWELTGTDEPDDSQIQLAVQAIEKLRGAQRIAFIQSVGEAAKVLTAEQHQILLGTMKPDASGTSDH
jgi:hypothetical protein